MKEVPPKISVIVPVYNSEQYLSQCIGSIVGQTFKDLEIILINDGSKDGSLQIMQEYAKKDARVQIIDKPNEGYGKTVNTGIDTAAGEYIGIVESDDWIEPDMYETLYNLAEKHNVQVVKSNWFKYKTTGSTKKWSLPEHDTGKVINTQKHSDIFYTQPSVWSAIYRLDFLNKYKIRFLESPGASYQDTGFNFKVWATADRVWLTSEAYLHYRAGGENQSVKARDKIFCICDEWAEIERFLENYPELKKSSYRLRNHVKLSNYIWNFERLEGQAREQFRKQFAREYTEAIKNGGIKFSCFTLQERLRFQKILYPQSLWFKAAYILQRITRVAIKTKITRGRKITFLFGLLAIRDVETGLPRAAE